MMPKEYTDILKALQDKGNNVAFSKIKVVYEHDLKTKIENVFSEFDEIPVASASLA